MWNPKFRVRIPFPTGSHNSKAKCILVGFQDKHSELGNSSMPLSAARILTIIPGNA